MQDGNSLGSFLVRDSASVPGNYCLSIRYQDKVLHYLVYQPEQSNRYCIHYTNTFESVQELIRYYHTHSEGICTELVQPCRLVAEAERKDENNGRWEVEHSTIQIVEKIGEGLFCQTFKGIWNGTIKVAVRSPLGAEGNLEKRSSFIEEASIMKQLRHTNIVQLYATCLKEEPLFILTELMTYGSLCENLHDDKYTALAKKSRKVFYDVSVQVARAMAHMERRSCIHRNLSSLTVLVGDNLVCKVANFSCAKKLASSSETYEAPSSEVFHPSRRQKTAPEAVLYRKFSIKSDVWSFGVLLYEIVTCGGMPYADMPNEELLQLTQQNVQGLRMPCPPSCPVAIYRMMCNCSKTDPSDRPSFDMLVQQIEDNITTN